MLSVPPAFVLSQDQTLYKSCISKVFRLFEILFNNACVITAYFLVFTWLFSLKKFQGSLLILALFNFQDAVLINQLIHYITFSSFCQVLFQVFSKNFFRDRHSEKRLNYYTTVSFVCQPLFRSFFKPVVLPVSDNLIIISLSNGFVKRFFKLFKEFLQT